MCTAAVSRLMLTAWVMNVACVLGPDEPVVHPMPVAAAITAVMAVASTRPRTLPYLIPFSRSWRGPSTTHPFRAELRDGFGAPAGRHTEHQPGQDQRNGRRGQADQRNGRHAETPVGKKGSGPRGEGGRSRRARTHIDDRPGRVAAIHVVFVLCGNKEMRSGAHI